MFFICLSRVCKLLLDLLFFQLRTSVNILNLNNYLTSLVSGEETIKTCSLAKSVFLKIYNKVIHRVIHCVWFSCTHGTTLLISYA